MSRLFGMLTSRPVRGVLLVLSFVLVAVAQSWPLPLYLSTRLPGDPTGDTGVYVWNTWVFRHELLTAHRWPLSTESILAIGGPADLSLHNYTIALNLMALPLHYFTNVVAAFNLVYLVNAALCGVGMFVLARRFAPAEAAGTSAAWLAGLLFACSPFLVARSTAHFSLAAAAALPFLAYWVDRAWVEGRARDGAFAGLCLVWAAYSDLYYAVYGVLLGAAVVLGRSFSLTWSRRTTRGTARTAVNALLVLLLAAVGLRAATGVESFSVGGLGVSMRTLYTPVLVLSVVAAIRVLMHWRWQARWTWPPAAWRALFALGVAAVVTSVLLLPELLALAARATDGRMVAAPVFWRSSAPGVDLLSFLLPNPNHPLAPSALVNWFAREPGRYEENVVSIPWVAILVIAVAWWRADERPAILWAAVACGAATLALGPFVRIAGLNTFLPTPWTFARYLPVVGEARVPSRFGVLVILAVAVLFGRALWALRARYPGQARIVTWAVAVLLACEVLPAPRHLYSAEVPAILDVVAADPRDVRVLTLPFGVRDGLSSLGDFSARTQVHQTQHEKKLIGGYLSRISDIRKRAYLDHPYVGALLVESAGGHLDDAKQEAAKRAAPAFVRDLKVGYVLIDRTRVGPEFERFALDTLDLRIVGQSGDLWLYVPGLPIDTPAPPSEASN